MKVFVVDQSFFGLLYDVQFSAALAEAGADVTLIGRGLRPYEEMSRGGFRYLPLYYGFAERLPPRLRPLSRLTKGIEHARGMAALVDLVRRERPDILHFQWIVLPLIDMFYLSKLRALAPLVLTVHNSVPYHGKGSSSLMLWGQDRALHAFQHFIPHTERIRAYLRGNDIPEAQMHLLSHPAVMLPRSPRPTPPIPESVKTILFFGNIRPYKGVDILIKAVIALAGRRRDFRVVIAGRPFFDLQPLHDEVEQNGLSAMVSFDSRYLDEATLAAYIESADIVVFPYREIDASGAFASASQFGIPIVASELGAFAEAPVRDYLRLVPPEQPAALADALEELLAAPGTLALWAARSKELGALMYSWETFAKDCLGIYSMLLADRKNATDERQSAGLEQTKT